MYQHLVLTWSVAAVLLASVTPAAAQDTSTVQRNGMMQDSADAGRVAGLTAARDRGVARYFAAGLLSGFPVGVAGPIVVGEASPDFVPVMVTTAGVAGVVGASVYATHSGVTLPAGEEAQLRGHGTAYQDAFRDAYTVQVQRRRKHAALWGGLTGTAIGVGALIFLLTHIST